MRVNTVSPGPTRTPAWEDEGGFGDRLAKTMGGGELSEFLEAFPGRAGITLGRLKGTDVLISGNAVVVGTLRLRNVQ